MADRRYSDDEISAIFAKAAEDPQVPARQPGAGRDDGLTLAELQEIGREAGIAPDAVARAARSMDSRPRVALRRFIGLPIGVERTVALNRWVTESEWEQLVVQLREVFDARGTVSAHGSFRQWTNGNLQALLEPTATGHRLRLKTTKASARAGTRVGLIAFGVGAAMSVATAAAGHLSAATPGVIMMVIGAGAIARSVLPLRNWARLRGRQMDEIASALALSEGDPAAERLP